VICKPENTAHWRPFLSRCMIGQLSLESGHTRFPPRVLDATIFGRIAPWIVVARFDDHQEPIAAPPDLHGFDALRSNVVDHCGPDRARLVHSTVLLDQCCIVREIEGQVVPSAHEEASRFRVAQATSTVVMKQTPAIR
jgi:hypothetical protein